MSLRQLSRWLQRLHGEAGHAGAMPWPCQNVNRAPTLWAVPAADLRHDSPPPPDAGVRQHPDVRAIGGGWPPAQRRTAWTCRSPCVSADTTARRRHDRVAFGARNSSASRRLLAASRRRADAVRGEPGRDPDLVLGEAGLEAAVHGGRKSAMLRPLCAHHLGEGPGRHGERGTHLK